MKLLLVASLVFVLSVPAWSQYTVDPAHLGCETVGNCKAIPNGCCGDATCTYTAINSAYELNYYNAATCAMMGCPSVMCTTVMPEVLCARDSNTVAGRCVLKTAGVVEASPAVKPAESPVEVTLPPADPCKGLTCGNCAGKEGCCFRHLTYSLDSNALPQDEYFCASSASNSAGVANLCAVDAGGIIAATTACPSTSTGSGVTSTDPKPYVDAVAGSDKPVSTKFTIVIALVIKVAATAATKNQVKLFVDLIGTAIPTDADKSDLCVILKNTLAGLDAKVPIEKVDCNLEQKLTVKRDVNYVATMSYPSEESGSSSTLIASFAAVAIAAVASLF